SMSASMKKVLKLSARSPRRAAEDRFDLFHLGGDGATLVDVPAQPQDAEDDGSDEGAARDGERPLSGGAPAADVVVAVDRAPRAHEVADLDPRRDEQGDLADQPEGDRAPERG